MMSGKRSIMINKAIALTVTGCCLVAPALADEPAPGSDEGRYTFSKIADGFVRLDTQTGEVALCGQRAVGWACEAVPEDRAVLENEIARLRRDNAALKKDLLSRGLPLPAGIVPEPPLAGSGQQAPQLGGNLDLDRMMAFVDQMWHRLVDAIARAQKQVFSKS